MTSTGVTLCTGDRDFNTNGGLYVSPDWGTTWVDELGTGSGRPWASAAVVPRVRGAATTGVGSARVILACLQNGAEMVDATRTGLWRKVGSGTSGTWSRVALPGYPGGVEFADTDKQRRLHVEWVSPTVAWISDPKSGLWQSRDAGLTWTRVWAETWATIYSGHIRRDPTRAGVLWAVTKGTSAYRIDGATTSTPTRTAVCAAATSPAAICVHPTTGRVFVAESGTAALWTSLDGVTWIDATTPSWEAMCSVVKDLEVSKGNDLFVAGYAGYMRTPGWTT